ncbi:hypothetical protein [Embleya sp. NPDC020630]|uniref:hypothetical protein n=1 Tax=Embleya sp. NPDC020630 TaxID=3363979 RepID=UPI003790D43D
MADFANPHKTTADDIARALRRAEAERLRGVEAARGDGPGPARETLRRVLVARELARIAGRRRDGGTAAGADGPAGGTTGPAGAAGGGVRHGGGAVLDALRGRSAAAAPGKTRSRPGRQPAAVPQPARPAGKSPAAPRHTTPAAPRPAAPQPAPAGDAVPDAGVPRVDLAETVRTAPSKAAVFDALRAATAERRADPGVLREVRARFGTQPDDLWLAETIVRSGPEPLWSTADLGERSRRAGGAQPWAAEPGNIAGGIEDPDPDPDVGSERARRIAPIPAYLFPGTDPDLRALIIGGVHGNEPEGREVVERLRARLTKESAEGRPPRYTTILVPELVVATHHAYGERPAFEKRLLPAGRARSAPGRVEPNRNLPFPGTSYQEARKQGAGGKPELKTLPIDKNGNPIRGGTPAPEPQPPRDTDKFPTSSVRMLPETRALLALLERFKPQRVVSVHAHGLTTKEGDAPGVFVDPRGIDPRTQAVTDKAAGEADDRLTARLAGRAAEKVPEDLRAAAFAGNTFRKTSAPDAGSPTDVGTPGNVRYASSAHGEGNSLGMYAPVPTSARQGATTITVEVPEFPTKAALDQVTAAHAEAIDEIILRNPT